MRWDNVVFDTPDQIHVKTARHAEITGGSNVDVRGEDVQAARAAGAAGAAGAARPIDCAGKFVPLSQEKRLRHTSFPRRYAAIVDARFAGVEGDSAMDATPTFRTVGRAITRLPANGIGRSVIFVRTGRYREKLTVERPFITLVGEHRDSTIMTYHAAADTPTP